jgi:hypothetical protein
VARASEETEIAVSEGRRIVEFDVAHNPETLFHHVHRGLTESAPERLVIAVHGFGGRGDDGPDVIVSAAGTQAPHACVVAALEGFPVRVARYPEDFGELGGVTGAQATHLRQIGGLMLHLELSPKARAYLRHEPDAIAALAAAIRGCMPPP